MSSIKSYWKSIGELEGDSSFSRFKYREFQEGASEMEGVGRRSFLKLLGASAGFAGLSGCSIRKPSQKIYSYSKQPEYVVPGKSLYYATSMQHGEQVMGLIVGTYEGRPTKIEGHVGHLDSMGATTMIQQASILNLYDPDRLRAPLFGSEESSWADFYQWYQGAGVMDSKGDGVAFLVSSQMSPSFYYMKNKLMKKYPLIKWYGYDAINSDEVYQGLLEVTGFEVEPVYHFDKAKTIISLDSDFIGNDESQVENTRSFLKNRDPEKSEMSRMYVFEPSFTLTGSKADHRVQVRSGDVEDVLCVILDQLSKRRLVSLPKELISVIEKRAVSVRGILNRGLRDSIVDDIRLGKSGALFVAGRRQSKRVHSMCYLVNSALGSKCVSYNKRRFSEDSMVKRRSLDSLSELVVDISSKKVNTLFILGGDPVYSQISDIFLNEKLDSLSNVIHLTESFNDTSAKSKWVLPLSHYLETWSDLLSKHGQHSIVQPMIKPMYDSLSVNEFLNSLLLSSKKTGYQILRESLISSKGSKLVNSNLKKWIHEGIISKSNRKINTSVRSNRYLNDLKKLVINDRSNLEITFNNCSKLYDGSFANNGWLQELPDPLTKLAWDNAAIISPVFAKKNNINHGDIIEIQVGKNRIETPVMVMPGHVDNSISLTVGYGRKEVGRVGKGVGVNVNQLRSVDNFYVNSNQNITINKKDKTYLLATSQEHWSIDDGKNINGSRQNGRPIVREANKDEYRNENVFKDIMKGEPLPAYGAKSPWKDVAYDKGNQWGMSIDLSKCTGCNACVIGCQAENNIPIVGKEEFANGREMHWIRVDRYFEGEIEDPRVVTQPVTCLHCENAPCEQVCPVNATVHSDEGTNDMVYNRCVGTRYCADNCPAKVRRFNFFDYNQRNPQSAVKDRQHLFDFIKEPDKSIQKQFNPNVTVRMRGVMEKCTFCMQRIRSVMSGVQNKNEKLKDGQLQTACQQVCPADAISFGDILDKKSKVVNQKKSKRNYDILEQLHLKARTSYLANITNQNKSIKNNKRKNSV
ncbi:hypothetical protein DID75_04130 [Candidatus Marinamargulisbacteria bacterium SCGC AG-410-N11]|nr:hypothetical protein DID75_04130 [Candidatus Marinamargulisbacteria bacterium SCGC AG-410-N11]